MSPASDERIAHDGIAATLPGHCHDRATMSARLGIALVAAGWEDHQHRVDVRRVEPESVAIADVDPETEAAISRVQAHLDALAGQPMPRLNLPYIPWPHDAAGRLRLDWEGDYRPGERTTTSTAAMPPDRAATLWKHVVKEIAAQHAHCDRPGRSAGRLFLGPKDRLIFWPRLMNAMLRHIPSTVGRIFDLFTVAAVAGVKLDVKAAYRALELTPDDAQYHAAILDGVWVVFNRLSFGMAQSPAAFTACIAVTIERFRGSLPATSAALAQYVDDSGLSGVAPPIAVRAMEQLIVALLRDGWWISLAKTFALPASQFVYTGFVADFGNPRAVRVAPSKAAKALGWLSMVKRPTDAAIAADVASLAGTSSAIPDLTTPATACAAPTAPGSDVAYTGAAPTAPHYTTTTPASAAPRAPAHTTTTPPGATHTTTSGAAPTAPDHVTGATSASAPSGRTDTGASGDSTPYPRWFHPDLALPDGFLPSQDRLPSPQDVRLPPHDGHRLSLEPEEEAALHKAIGYMAWFQVGIDFLAPWRALLQDLLNARRWSPERAAAFDDAYALLHVLHTWRRRVDPVPGPVLHVICDASATGWGAHVYLGDDSATKAYFCGTLDAPDIAASSTRREAIAAASAIVAAIRAGMRFSAVEVVVDSRALVGSTAAGHVRSASVARVVATLAAWAAQGLRVSFTWWSRDEAGHAVPDALSGVARPQVVWPLRTDLLSALWTRTGGWDVDIAAAGHASSTVLAYATPTMDVPTDRDRVADGIVDPGRVGWRGTTLSAPVHPGEVAFAHPAWSQLGAIASRIDAAHRFPFPLVLVAPRDSSSWWAPHLERVRAAAWEIVALPENATVPPVPGAARDPLALSVYRLGPRPPSGRPPRPFPNRLDASARPDGSDHRPPTGAAPLASCWPVDHRAQRSPFGSPAGLSLARSGHPPGDHPTPPPPRPSVRPAGPVRRTVAPSTWPSDPRAQRSPFGSPAGLSLARSGHPPGDRPIPAPAPRQPTGRRSRWLPSPPRAPATQPPWPRAASTPAPPRPAVPRHRWLPEPAAPPQVRRLHRLGDPSPLPSLTAAAPAPPTGPPSATLVVPTRHRSPVPPAAATPPAAAASARWLPAPRTVAPTAAPARPSPPPQQHRSSATAPRLVHWAAAAAADHRAGRGRILDDSRCGRRDPPPSPSRRDRGTPPSAAAACSQPACAAPALDPRCPWCRDHCPDAACGSAAHVTACMRRIAPTQAALRARLAGGASPVAAATASAPAGPLAASAASPAPYATFGAALAGALRVHGGSPGAVPAAPAAGAAAAAHVPAMEAATALGARKALIGSGALVTLLELCLKFASYRRVRDHPWSLTQLEAFMVDFATQRIDATLPIVGWSRVKAATALNDASIVAAALRRAGLDGVPPHCGERVKAYCVARGARDVPEHSAAFPLHLSLLLAAEPSVGSDDREAWEALTTMVLFCLRTGIVYHLYSDMFVAYDGGYLFVWRHTHKRVAGLADVADIESLSRIGSITGARHPILHRIINRGSPNHRLFPTLTAKAMTDFARRHVLGVPGCFDIRSYGTRTSSAHDANVLHTPDHVVNRIFWWKPKQAQMKTYYSSQTIAEAYAFSERRAELKFHHFFPGTADARVPSISLRDWSTVGVGRDLPPPPPLDHIRAALQCVAPSFIMQRAVRADVRAKRARRAAGDTSTASESGEAPVASGRCTACAELVDTDTDAAACVRCTRIICMSCWPDLSADWHCPAHRRGRRRTTGAGK